MTEGNPFFLNEVLRQMAAEGRLASDASSVPTRLTIPQGVIEFIKNLIQPLPQDARSVLELAAVIGRVFELNRLEAASGMPRDAMTDLLDKAEALELVHRTSGAPGRYNFRHALIREALYDALPAAQRRRLHRDVAEAIRGLNAPREPYAEIAYHYCQSASPGDAEAAIEFSRLAARAAEKQLAYEEAALHLGNAIELLALKRAGDDAFLAELLCDLGEAQVKTGDLAEMRKTCLKAADIARRIGRADLYARAILAPGRVLSASGVTDQALVVQLEEARALLERRTVRCSRRPSRGWELSFTGRIARSPSRFVSRPPKWPAGSTTRTRPSSRSGVAGIRSETPTAWSSASPTPATSSRWPSARASATLRSKPATTASRICSRPETSLPPTSNSGNT